MGCACVAIGPILTLSRNTEVSETGYGGNLVLVVAAPEVNLIVTAHRSFRERNVFCLEFEMLDMTVGRPT